MARSCRLHWAWLPGSALWPLERGVSVSQLAVHSGCNDLGVRDCERSPWSPQSWPGPGTEELATWQGHRPPFSAVSSERRGQGGPRTVEDTEATALSRRHKVCVRAPLRTSYRQPPGTQHPRPRHMASGPTLLCSGPVSTPFCRGGNRGDQLGMGERVFEVRALSVPVSCVWRRVRAPRAQHTGHPRGPGPSCRRSPPYPYRGWAMAAVEGAGAGGRLREQDPPPPGKRSLGLVSPL